MKERFLVLAVRQPAMKIDVSGPNEVSFPVCEADDGSLYAGTVLTGTPTATKISAVCNGGKKPVALVHTHPGLAMVVLSAQDAKASRETGVPVHCIIKPETKQVACYRMVEA